MSATAIGMRMATWVDIAQSCNTCGGDAHGHAQGEMVTPHGHAHSCYGHVTAVSRAHGGMAKLMVMVATVLVKVVAGAVVLFGRSKGFRLTV